MTDRMYGPPLDAPLDREPDTSGIEAIEVFRIALLHVGVLGGWDRTIGAWLLDTWDTGTIATAAAWLRRAYRRGVEAGRREVLDEEGEGRLDLAALADDIRGLADHADRILTDGESGAQDVLEALLDGLRRTVETHTTDPGHLAEVAARARARYFGVLAGDVSSAQRQTAVVISVDMAVTALLGDSDLAAATRAIIGADRELDDALADLDDPPACQQCSTPVCARCPADDGHSTPLAAAGLAAGALGVAGLVATHTGSPGLGLVLAAVGGITGVAVLVLGRRGRDGGAS